MPEKMEDFVGEIIKWVRKNKLKLSNEKTEVLVISTPFFTDSLQEIHIRIGDASI